MNANQDEGRSVWVVRRASLAERAGRVTGLQTLRPRPSGFTGEWNSPQSVSIESNDEGAYRGLTLGQDVVVLTRTEFDTLVDLAEEGTPR